MPDTWRLFIAIELPHDVLEALTTVQEHLKRSTPPGTVRWVQPEGIHLTLKFLGDVPVAQRDALQAALGKTTQGHIMFEVRLGKLGCFPNFRRPRVVWVGIESQSDTLVALHDSVERHIAPLGFPTEERPFSPHLTLGRVRREARQEYIQKLGEQAAQTPAADPLGWHVRQISLIRSELKPTGAVYTPLFHAPLHT